MKPSSLPATLPATFSRGTRRLRRLARRSAAPFLTTLTAATGGAGLAWAQNLVEKAAAPASAPSNEVTLWQAPILGIIQGLTEFIPVSSSGHLNIAHALMGHNRELGYDILLHVGTVAALIFYFRHDWKALLVDPAQKRMRNLIFLACVPAVIGGLATRPFQDTAWLFSAPEANALMLIVAGAILLAADKLSSQAREMNSIGVKDSLLIGLGQAIALIPGVSRSGATLTAGLFLGLKRADAARFSFLMSLPIMLGAFAYEFSKVARGEATIEAAYPAMFAGVLSSAVAGFWAIGFLLNYLKTRDVTPFFVWRVLVALAVFAFFSSRS